MIAAEVLGIRCPTCADCRDSARPCLLGCDSLPAEITVRPEGRADTYIYLANHDVLGDVVRALGDANTRVLLSPDEARALISRSMLDELDRQDATQDVTRRQAPGPASDSSQTQRQDGEDQ